MSDALDYLVKARPDAMAPYLKFMKEAGKHLDPKTRDLISVITKVHSQTEKGLRQYLTRALRNGCAPREIIDALLMAFPALGLAKIVWAADVILKMDLPEFRPENLDKQPDWHDLLAANDAADDEITYADCDGRSLFIYRKGNEYRVYDSRCPHQVTNIPHLALEGKHLTCPKHQWKFDVTTGQCVEKGNRPLREFKARVEGGRVQAFW
ncbi:MAG: Rieske 2Fe-2S domain-containing protein [Gammaproteobacteria bacterium]|nr:Rieske 2Fe-2S domain-containing protein [Gammaproteobacteria bacterium]